MTFDFQPTLKGERAIIRPLAQDDFEPLCQIASDPEVWEQHPVPELVEHEVFIANLKDALEDQGGLVVLDQATGTIIGYSRFSQRFCGPEVVEIGWTMLAPSRWGGQYNGDMKRAMLNHAFASAPQLPLG